MSEEKPDIVTRLRQTRANMIGTDDEEHYWDCHVAATMIEKLREQADKLVALAEKLQTSMKKRVDALEARLKQMQKEALEAPGVDEDELDADPKYNGYTLTTEDIIIDGCRLICTCGVCPEQYDVFEEASGDQIGYLRLRRGWFRADAWFCGGMTVYEAYTRGDGCFDDDERMPQLTAAVAAIKKYVAENDVRKQKDD